MKWISIDSAPKDGSTVLVGHPKYGAWFAKWGGGCCKRFVGKDCRPTHWFTLPPIPITSPKDFQ